MTDTLSSEMPTCPTTIARQERFHVTLDPKGPSPYLDAQVSFHMRSATEAEINALLDLRYADVIVEHGPLVLNVKEHLASLAEKESQKKARKAKTSPSMKPRAKKLTKKQQAIEQLNALL